MLSKLARRPITALTPFDMVRCTWDGLIHMTSTGFKDGEYLPEPAVLSAKDEDRRLYRPDAAHIWLLFRSQHACFTHFDLNQPETIMTVRERIANYGRILSGEYSPTVTFLRTIIAANPMDELSRVAEFHKAVRMKSNGNLKFRTVMVMHDQESETKPVCCYPEEERDFSSPCVVWNLHREAPHVSASHTPSEAAEMGKLECTTLKPISLFDQCHAGYERIITQMSQKEQWEEVMKLPSYDDYVASRSSSGEKKSAFQPYNKLNLVAGLPAVRGTCTGFGSTLCQVSKDDPCPHCGSCDGHSSALSAPPSDAAVEKPWSEDEMWELMLFYAMHNGDEVATVEGISLQQGRQAAHTFQMLKGLLKDSKWQKHALFSNIRR